MVMETVAPGQLFFSGCLLQHTANESFMYYRRKKHSIMRKGKYCYLFVQASSSKKGYAIINRELCEISDFVEDTRISHI